MPATRPVLGRQEPFTASRSTSGLTRSASLRICRGQRLLAASRLEPATIIPCFVRGTAGWRPAGEAPSTPPHMVPNWRTPLIGELSGGRSPTVNSHIISAQILYKRIGRRRQVGHARGEEAAHPQCRVRGSLWIRGTTDTTRRVRRKARGNPSRRRVSWKARRVARPHGRHMPVRVVPEKIFPRDLKLFSAGDRLNQPAEKRASQGLNKGGLSRPLERLLGNVRTAVVVQRGAWRALRGRPVASRVRPLGVGESSGRWGGRLRFGKACPRR